MTDLCFERCDDGEGSNSITRPCLLDKGHAGSQHMHKPLCNTIYCLCGGMYSRMSSADKMYYEELIQKRKDINTAIDRFLAQFMAK